VPGGHISMLEEPNVSGLARELIEMNNWALSVETRIGRIAVERRLRTALAQQRFGSEVSLFLEQRSTLDPEAQAVIDRCDAAGRAISSMARLHGQAAVDALSSAGVAATLGVVPNRQQHCSATVSLTCPADQSGATVTKAVEALTELGYLRQTPRHLSSWDEHARAHQSCTLIRPDSSTTRLTLTWKRDDAFAAITDISDEHVDHDDHHDLGIFLGTPTSVIAPILVVGEVGRDDLVVDIGCGDGRVLIEAVRHFGCRARGIEIDPVLAAVARTRVDEAGLSDRIEVIEGDASADDPQIATLLADATVVFTFLPIEITALLLPRLVAQLTPGGRVVAHEQLAVEWSIPPDRSELVIGEDAITVASMWRSSRAQD
jgi:precorrin-6B methylase 2